MEKELTESQFFIGRHAKPAREATAADPKSAKFPDLTESGEVQAREKARTGLQELIKSSPRESVIFIAGTSDQPRTKQTTEIYGDELDKVYAETGGGVVIINKTTIDGWSQNEKSDQRQKKSFSPGRILKILKRLNEVLEENKGKKVVVVYPLMIKELAYKYKNRWTDAEGAKTPYFDALLKKHNQNHDNAGEDWIRSQGRLELAGGERVLQGPVPNKVAEEYLLGVKRLDSFIKKQSMGRPVVVGEVGHQWDLDAVVTYLSNNGKVDWEGYKRASQSMGITKETEVISVVMDPKTNRKLVVYRGKDFLVNN